MWNDNPSEVDLLGFQRYVQAIEQLAVMDSLQPLTIGVFGTWGSGKTSVMRLAHTSLQTKEGVASVWISSWALEDFEHTKSALIISILNALKQNQSFVEKLRPGIQKLLRRVDWMRASALIARSSLAVGTAFVAAQTAGQPPTVAMPTLDETSKVFKTADDDDVTSITEFHAQFSDLLDSAKIRSLVVFLDDLDRCMPRTIIQNFEAIRLFLAVPKSVFVIGASEEIIRAAVNTQYPNQESGVSYGQQYLEKIIQIPIHLPPLNPQETLKYLSMLFAHRHLDSNAFRSLVDNLAKHELDAENPQLFQASDILAQVEERQRTSLLTADLDVAIRITPSLHDGTRGNPREIKRFLNTLVLRQLVGASVGLKFDLAIMAKLMLLEYYHNAHFKTLFEWNLAYGQKIPHLRYLEDQVSAQFGTLGGVDDLSQESSDSQEAVVAQEATFSQDVVSSTREWLENGKLRAWIGLPPPLADTDLTPYFYLARESLDMRGALMRPLSKEARKVLDGYFYGGEINRNQANDALKSLDRSDVDDILAQLLRQYQAQQGNEKWRQALVDVGITRPDIVANLIQRLRPLLAAPSSADVMAFGKIAQAHPQHRDLILAWFDELGTRNPRLENSIKMVKKHPSVGKAM